MPNNEISSKVSYHDCGVHWNCNNWRKAHGFPLIRKGRSKRKRRKTVYVMLDETWLLSEYAENAEMLWYSKLMKTVRRAMPMDTSNKPVAGSEALAVIR